MMLHLLTETSIYMHLPNDCYAQLTGPPIIYSTLFQQGRLYDHAGTTSVRERLSALALKRKIGNNEEATRPKKRRRIELEGEVGEIPRKRETNERRV